VVAVLLAAGVIALGIYLVALGVRTAMVPAAFFAAVFIYGSATGRWVQFRGRPPRK
jgi:hypothetical protein